MTDILVRQMTCKQHIYDETGHCFECDAPEPSAERKAGEICGKPHHDHPRKENDMELFDTYKEENQITELRSLPSDILISEWYSLWDQPRLPDSDDPVERMNAVMLNAIQDELFDRGYVRICVNHYPGEWVKK